MSLVERLPDKSWDLIVIGGGITGAGVARDAAMRGIDTILLEKDDFACGTSSGTTKLIHGGLRYLEQYDFGLVQEALRERKILMNIAPHQVYPSKFLFPVYKESRVFPLQLRAGLIFYDLLAWRKGIGRHKFINPNQVRRMFPGLKQEGLKTAGLYYDCQMDDARLVLENVIDAQQQGAAVANYAEVVGLERSSSQSKWRLTVKDKAGGEEFTLNAEAIVNSTGPWSDDFAKHWRSAGNTFLRPTKGVHLILPPLQTEIAGFFPSIHDDRLFFVIPWQDKTLLGTTDTDFSGSPDNLRTNDQDREYLLSNINHYLEDVEFEKSDILADFAALRPLYSTSKGKVGESEVSRDHEILVEEDSIYTIIGGKYTTYRVMAKETLDLIGVRESSLTAEEKLPGAWEKENHREKLKARLLANYSLSPIQIEELLNRYGAKAEQVVQQTSKFSDHLEPVGELKTPIRAQVYYAVTNEYARKAKDIVRRRTGLFMHKNTLTDKVKELINKIEDSDITKKRGLGH